ncbi:cellulase family glycosylhydrolase [Lapillicoccus sp.]|uniref:glycoside hydrolase 5 family protein n=1 Tax=Lapillicoccus sp. TaxID=1909287 RepID=UPI0025CECE11|nr:cellulase family glycosylhydrolase [Lapillicoccus sp.]
MTRSAHRPDAADTPSAAGLSRRRVLGSAALATAAVTGAALVGEATPASAATTSPSVSGPPSLNRSFVQVRRGRFEVDGKAFRFGGTNTYYLHQQSHYMIDSALDDAAAMGLAVVRCWAFADGTGPTIPLQPRPFVYDEAAFDSLDYAVWKAGQLGLRLVLTLVNNWPDYGGMQQYVQWFLGLPDDSYGAAVNHDRFYTDPVIRRCYREWTKHVVTRRNRYTGQRYNADPTIMTFELANEPRNRSDKTGAPVLAWVKEMSTWLRQWAPAQLIAVGDEGFFGQATNADYPYSNYEGMHWEALVKVPDIDYGTVHVYPQGWGEISSSKPGTTPVAWGTQWIRDHLTAGHRLNTPVVVEEYGLAIDATKDVPDVATRDTGYAAWTAEVETSGWGDQFWLLTSRVDDGSFYPDYDGYRIMWRADDTNPSRTTATLLSQHAARMRQP